MVSLQEVRFTSGLKYYDNGTLYMSSRPEDIAYVGDPAPELDRSWNDLIGSETVVKYCKPGPKVLIRE